MRLFWHKQKWQNRIMVICLDFLRSLNNVHKFSSRNSKSYKFHGKIYFKHFDLFINCTLYLKSSTKVFSTTWRTNWWKTGPSVKPSISEMTFWKCPWYLSIISLFVLTYCFSYFSIITTYEVTSFVFVLQCFSWSNSLVPFSFLLRHYYWQYNQIEIEK